MDDAWARVFAACVIRRHSRKIQTIYISDVRNAPSPGYYVKT